MSAPVALEVRKNSIRFELHQPHTNITAIEKFSDACIGELSKEELYTLIEQSFQKVLIPLLVESKLYGLNLYMHEGLSVREYKRNLHNGYATLSVDLLDRNAKSKFVNLTDKSNKPCFWPFCFVFATGLISKRIVKFMK